MEERMAEATKATMTRKTPARRLILALTLVSATAGLAIVLAYQWTLPVIEAKKREALKEAILRIRPETRRILPFMVEGSTILPLAEEGRRGRVLYAGYNETLSLTGIWSEASGSGYQDRIVLLFAVDPRRQRIIGMEVLESKETPGLGDRIEKDERFRANFEALDASLDGGGRKLEHEIRTVREGRKKNPWEIDGITGATISSKAVGRILNGAAQKTMPLVVRELEKFGL